MTNISIKYNLKKSSTYCRENLRMPEAVIYWITVSFNTIYFDRFLKYA